MSDLNLEDCDVELRGITDVADTDYDHIAQIHSWFAAAKDKSKTKLKELNKPKKRADYKNSDYWIVNEGKCVLVRHHVKQRQNLMGFRYLRGELPVDAKRLTGHRQTERFFLDGTSDVMKISVPLKMTELIHHLGRTLPLGAVGLLLSSHH